MFIKKRHLSAKLLLGLKVSIIGIVCVVVLQTIFILRANIASAEGFSWSGEIGYTVDESQDAPADQRSCTEQDVYVDKIPNRNYIPNTDTVQACVYDQGDFRYAQYSRQYKGWPGNNLESNFVISVGQDNKMYRVNNLSENYLPDFMANSRSLVYSINRSSSLWGEKLEIYKDAVDRLTKNADNTYTIDKTSSDFELKRPNGYVLPVGGVGSSANGRWLAFEVVDLGIVRLDMDTFEIKRVSSRATGYGFGNNPIMALSISNDGQYIATGGLNSPFYIYRATNDCGDSSITDDMTTYIPVSKPCEEVNLGNTISAYYSKFSTAYDLKFNEDGGELSFRATEHGGANPLWVKLRAGGYTPPTQLDYLALGDSYSSGEGDVDWKFGNKVTHYLPNTDIKGDYAHGIPEEKCHVSDRSYPFKISLDMRLSKDEMKSMACSGAKRIDVQGYDTQRNTNIYDGQVAALPDGMLVPRLAPIVNKAALQADAKQNYIPGRVQQIEFAERNKPKVTTVTMGGNDVGFGEVIRACVTKITPTTTCSHAGAQEGRAIMGKSIRNQFVTLRDMYTSIKKASPDTRIYVLGYPQFISNIGNVCGLNTPLNISERTMMVEGVKYFNKIAKAAASEAGVKYIDIEDSLGDHVLCGLDEKYVNGIGEIIAGSEQQEAFHPNAKGQNAIYTKVKNALNGQSLGSETICNDTIVCPGAPGTPLPEVPEYFAEPMSEYEWAVEQVDMIRRGVDGVAEVVKKAGDFAIKINPMLLQPTSIVHVELHSDPTQLGTFTAAVDGSLNAEVSLPATIPAGYHTLHMYGKSYSGEPIDYYQIVQVHGSDGDLDDNGVSDSQQKCLFIPSSGVDADMDSTDDACDLDISDKPQLYRVRNGDIANGEQAAYMYIERNIKAASITGVSGDYDPNGDGWAIVAVSKGAADSGAPANFWVDEQKKPHVSIRTAESGCVQYTATSLAKVKPALTRTLKKETVAATTCRFEPAGEDVDKDGMPDNEQQLYRARNGDSSKGEDPQRIYLDRSRAAAEAQQGISDYAPLNQDGTLQAWNLLASSQGKSTKGTFKKLIMHNGEPIVLMQTPTSVCAAMKPIRTTVIKKSTQSERGFVRIAMPENVGCE